MKKVFYFVYILSLSFVVSCSTFEDDKESQATSSYNVDLSNVVIDNGTVVLPSKEYLNQIVNDYKKGNKEQNSFNKKIIELQNQSFRPLIPIFSGLNTKQIEEFVVRKKERINQRNIDYGLYNRNIRDFELDLDDDIITDPVLAALLNEDREIIIADILYKYTELGLLFIQKDSKLTLLDYVNNKTPEERYNLILQHQNEFSLTNKPEEKIESLGDGLTSFRMLPVLESDNPNDDGGGGDDGGSSSSGTNDGDLGGTNGTGAGQVVIPGSSSGTGAVTTQGDGVFNPASFGECPITSDGFFEDIFGESESCFEYYNDNRRVKVKFWNQNFFLFASIGSTTRLQKREHLDLLIGTISWWEQSFATKIRLGVNNVTFKYNYNVPLLNPSLTNYQTTFFEYNGTKYNVNGQVIPTVPTSAGNFQFPVNNANNVVDITILGADVQLDNGNINQGIDFLLDQFINQVQSFDTKQELLAKKAAGTLEVRALYAKPYATSVKLIIAKQNWSANDENCITHYFDFNFSISYNSSTNYNTTNPNGSTNYQAYANLWNALANSTDYEEVKADIYGAALHNNYWKGRRLFTE